MSLIPVIFLLTVTNIGDILKSVQRNSTTAKGENEVIARCTGDTNVIPGKGKGIMRRSRNLR